MIHLDLFSGIGGFAYAADQVWENCEHIFCESDPFCRQVLKKHWKDAIIYEDIKTTSSSRIIADASSKRFKGSTAEQESISKGMEAAINATNTNVTDTTSRKSGKQTEQKRGSDTCGSHCDILTGGFPCQPFSVAGRKKGKEDNRYLWDEMFRIISDVKPHLVIGENVAGIVNMVLHEVQADLESEGYETQCFIIPACAVNAPHRRDRVWIVAHRQREGYVGGRSGSDSNQHGICENQQARKETRSAITRCDEDALHAETEDVGLSLGTQKKKPRHRGGDWNKNWIEAATELCGMDDGLPVTLDGLKLCAAGHRRERLKSLGNAIVPQVAIEIMKAIKQSENLFKGTK